MFIYTLWSQYIDIIVHIILTYVNPIFILMPLSIQLFILSFITSFFELPPILMGLFYLLSQYQFSLYTVFSVLSGLTLGFYISDLLIYHFISQITINNISNYIVNKINQYLNEYTILVYLWFIMYRIIPYARTPCITVLTYNMPMNVFSKYNLYSAIVMSIIIIIIMYFLWSGI